MSDIAHTLAHCFGSDMIDEGAYQTYLQALEAPVAALKKRECAGTTPLLELAQKTDDLSEIQTLADSIREQSDHVVVCGSGGSGLSGRIFAQLAQSQTDIHFLENIDPDHLAAALQRVNVKRCHFIIISKSGGTVETHSQFAILLQQVREAGGDGAKQFTVITMPQDSKIRSLAAQHGIPIYDHPADIGGRFSALTIVGLLPAELCGLDIAGLRAGAAQQVQALDDTAYTTAFAPAQGAALHRAALDSGRNISVIWPYGEKLAGFAAWYRQSWAESLGKQGKGSTPIMAMGSTDQHSQLQLFLDGPKDKLFHLITAQRAQTGPQLPNEQHTLGDMMQAQQMATYASLRNHHCPVRHIELEQIDETSFGALLMHFTLEIVFMAALLGVNPFDQPAVEESKQMARDHLKVRA